MVMYGNQEPPCVKSADLPAAIDELARNAWPLFEFAGKDTLFGIFGGRGEAPRYSYTNTHALIRQEEDGKILDVKLPTRLHDLTTRRARAKVERYFNGSFLVYQSWQDGALQEKRIYKELAMKNIPSLTVVDVETPYLVTEYLPDLEILADRLLNAEPDEKLGLLRKAASQLKTIHHVHGPWGDAWLGNFAFHEGLLLALDFEYAPNPALWEDTKRAKDVMNFYLNAVGHCAQGTKPLKDEREIATAILEAYNPSKNLAFRIANEATIGKSKTWSHQLARTFFYNYPVHTILLPGKVHAAQKSLSDVVRSEFC